MVQQLNLLGSGQIIPTALHIEMQQSYLEYAMSVIVGRALPDVRDGLKPVHRRILYAMYELGLTPDRPFRKCARVVGDVLGKYHPHGDQAVYDALVRMVQEFSSRYPLLSGHGNFGSVDNDPPAAMRYTETRLASIAFEAMLNEISDSIVNFTSNFDNSQQEPVVLPCQLPILLLNGCTGIAVGMATNIPPHNLGEIVDGLIALIDNPDLPDHKLWELIPGPDFPTGGEIVDATGIWEAYATGKGIIPVRGVVNFEQMTVGKRRRKEITAIVVTELPYQVNKAAWIEKIADLVNQGRLEGIADIRDESDRQGMRVVIELKKDTNSQEVLEHLYRQTALQSNFGAIMLALVDNKPCQLSLRELLTEFLKFREQTLTRQYGYELEKCQQRLHLVEGLLKALANLDAMIDILRHAVDGTTAKFRLVEELDLSEAQADSILAMPMRRITGLEQQKLQSEYQELTTRIRELETLLRDRHELLKSLKKELRSLKKKFADPRRTKITAQKPPKTVKAEVVSSKNTINNNNDNDLISQRRKGAKELSTENDQVSLSDDLISQRREGAKRDLSTDSEIRNNGEKRVKTSTPKQSKKRQEDVFELPIFAEITKPENAEIIITNDGLISWQSGENIPDLAIFREKIGNKEQLVVITDQGKAYPLSVNDITQIPTSLLSLLPNSAQKDSQRIVNGFFIPENKKNIDLVLLSQEGKIKRLSLVELNELTNRGLALIKLKEQDRLKYCCLAQDGEEIAIATNGGRVLRFEINDQHLPIMGRNAQGNQALRVRSNEQLVGCISLNRNDSLLLITEEGYGKRLAINSLRLAKPGDIGSQALQFSSKTDHLAAIINYRSASTINLITNHQNSKVLSGDAIPFWGKDGTGDPIIKLKSSERIIRTALL